MLFFIELRAAANGAIDFRFKREKFQLSSFYIMASLCDVAVVALMKSCTSAAPRAFITFADHHNYNIAAMDIRRFLSMSAA